MLSGFSSSISSWYLRMLLENETNYSSVVCSAIRRSNRKQQKTIKVTRVKTPFLTGTIERRCCCFLDN